MAGLGLLGLTLAAAGIAAPSLPLRSAATVLLLAGIGLVWARSIRRLQRLEQAVGHMWQGLALFDAEERLVLSNPQLAHMFGLAPAVLDGVVTHRDLLARLIAAGAFPGQSVEEMWQLNRAFVAERRRALFYRDLPDGRLIAVSHEPLPDGGWVRTFADVTGRRRAEAQVIHMARHDVLTDLPNRQLFQERLEQALERATGRVAVLCLDLDGFKAVNDTLGHPVGDALLQAVAARLRQCAAAGDTVARLGGDEFAIVQIDPADPEAALALALRLVGSIGAPYEIDGRRVAVQTCVGVALAPADGRDAGTLLHKADLALYHAKGAGRGEVRLFRPAMDAVNRRRLAMELNLREALALGQFHLEYQPIIELRTWRIEAFEALLRWTHPTLGAIGPDEFVPVAERIGLMGLVAEWVLREACAAAAGWPAEVAVAVNLSPLREHGELVVAAVMEALAQSSLPARRLELEITERAVLQDDAASRQMLQRLAGMGVRLTMDDFGTGYSSLAALYRFPLDRVKIDRVFVRDLAKRPEALAVLRAVVQLALHLDIRTTVEGVETADQLGGIVAERCDSAQGYLFGAPLRAEALPGFLADWRGKPATPAARSARADAFE